jgi:3-phosphoshikimate 1-carboxyvinyltransferase
VRVIVTPIRRIRGSLTPPGDKSISHRAALLGALAHGTTEVHGFLEADDCLNSLRALGGLGIEWSRKAAGDYLIHGAGEGGLREPETVLDCGNSGTTCRLLLGMLAGQPFAATLTGDGSLRRRPMARVTEPLSQMGARVLGREGGRLLPLTIEGRRPLKAVRFRMPVASAQVKSALLLAGLFADGPVVVEEPSQSRDHTERMLSAFGARVSVDGLSVTVEPGRRLEGRFLAIPGDLSSAAFFFVAGALAPEGEVTVSRVGLNPTRTGCLEVLRAMGAAVSVRRGEEGWEPEAEVTVSASTLRGVTVGGDLIPRLIDEIPVLAVAMACAHGVSEIRDGAELRV